MQGQKMFRRAMVGVVAIGVSIGAMATGASAGPIDTAKNKASYYEDAGYGTCVKYDHKVDSFTVPEADSGTEWTLLVLKAGSARSVATVNDEIPNPVTGQTYTHSSGKNISHVIICHDDNPYGGGGYQS